VVAGNRTAGNLDCGFPKQSIVKPTLKMQAVCYFTRCLQYQITRSHKLEDRNVRLSFIKTYFETALINSHPKQTHRHFLQIPSRSLTQRDRQAESPGYWCLSQLYTR
jgi:hypothetical protein